MRTFFIMSMLALATTGCTKYVELKHAEARIWLMSENAEKVYRCVDLVPDTGTPGHHVVECIRAKMRSSAGAENE